VNKSFSHKIVEMFKCRAITHQ